MIEFLARKDWLLEGIREVLYGVVVEFAHGTQALILHRSLSLPTWFIEKMEMR